MLQTLRIQNYALIDSLEIEFQPGFNVLTGETGAGKSIVIGALDLVLGARASSDVVRRGAEQAKIAAVFSLPACPARLAALLAEHSLELDGDDLLLSRVVATNGRSKAYVAGSLVPLNVLAAIGDELVDLHGQHEHQSLMHRDRQLALIDAYGGTESLAAAFGDRVRALRALEAEIETLSADDRDRERRLDFLRFEAEEIASAGLSPGEDAELAARRSLITNAEQLTHHAARACEALAGEGDGPALDRISAALRDVEALAKLDPRFTALAARIDSARSEIEAAVEELRGFGEALEFDPQELDTINARLSQIRQLSRKYGASIEDILAYRDKALAEIASFTNRDERLERLRHEHASALAGIQESAAVLSKRRQAAAKKLRARVVELLRALGMKGGDFAVRFDEAPLSLTGTDRAEFLLSANPGEPLKPLREVASGGEISRIMLALKAVFADADAIPTLVFDEIDAGVGGQVAVMVGETLASLAASHQLIVITHLPQIAARAAAHFNVAKVPTKEGTTTRVSRVENDSRVRELARLLDGSVTDVSLRHAEALLGAGR